VCEVVCGNVAGSVFEKDFREDYQLHTSITHSQQNTAPSSCDTKISSGATDLLTSRQPSLLLLRRVPRACACCCADARARDDLFCFRVLRVMSRKKVMRHSAALQHIRYTA
jgi:hypothetical protein